MNNKESHSTTSIEQLYKNRKQQHKMPKAMSESLHQALLRSATKKKRRQQWRYATPFAVASVLAVVFIWPNKTELYAPQKAFQSAMQINSDSIEASKTQSISPTLMASDNKNPVQTGLITEEQFTVMDGIVMEEPRDAGKLLESTQAGLASINQNEAVQPASIPAEALEAEFVSKDNSKDAVKREKVIKQSDLQSLEDTEAFEDVANSTPIERLLESDDQSELGEIAAAPAASDINRPMGAAISRIASDEYLQQWFVKVIDGEKGLFEDCNGEEIEHPVKTALVGWITISLDQDNHYSIDKLDAFKCDSE